MTRVEFRMTLRSKIQYMFTSLALILALVWLLRSVLLIPGYGDEIAYAFMALLFLSNVMSVKIDQGAFGLLSSLASSIGSYAVDLSISFFIGGFLGLGEQFTRYTLALFVGGLVLFVVSWKTGRLVEPKRPRICREVVSLGNNRLEFAAGLVADSPRLTGMPIKMGNKVLGAVTVDDFDLLVKTTLGPVKVAVKAPALVLGPHLTLGEKVRDPSDSELRDAEMLYSKRRDEVGGTSIRLPFLSVEEHEGLETEVQIGPFRVSDTEAGAVVDIPPFIHITSDSGGPGRRVFVTSGSDGRAIVTWSQGTIKARWNGWSVKTDGETHTVLRKGSSFAKDRAGSLIVGSPGYTLNVSGDNVSVQLPDMQITATPGVLVLTSGGKSQRMSDERLSKRFIDAMVEVARDQISRLMAGEEPDPADVYVEIDSLLGGSRT